MMLKQVFFRTSHLFDCSDLSVIWKLLSPSIWSIFYREIPDRHYSGTFLQLKMLTLSSFKRDLYPLLGMQRGYSSWA